MSGTPDPQTDPLHIELADLSARPDAVLDRALGRLIEALESVRANLAAGTADGDERDWARVVVQAAAGLHARASVADLAAHLLDLADHHVDRLIAERLDREAEARALGQTVDYVRSLPTTPAEIVEHMRGKRNPDRLVVEDQGAKARGALIREAMVALDERLAAVDYERILTERPKANLKPPSPGPVPLQENVQRALSEVGLHVGKKQLKARR